MICFIVNFYKASNTKLILENKYWNIFQNLILKINSLSTR